MRQINRGELQRARPDSQRNRPSERLADRSPTVCREQPSQRAACFSHLNGPNFQRGERCETDNAHKADGRMQIEAHKGEKLRNSGSLFSQGKKKKKLYSYTDALG